MLLLLVFYYVGYWKLFDKMNLKGWECLLPIYNEYLLCKNIEIDKRFMMLYLFISGFISLMNFIYLILSLVIVLFMSILPFLFMFILSGKPWMLNFDGVIPMLIIYIFFFLIYSIMRGFIVYKLSLKFGNCKMLSLILGIFNFIGIFVLGFGNSKYFDDDNSSNIKEDNNSDVINDENDIILSK